MVDHGPQPLMTAARRQLAQDEKAEQLRSQERKDQAMGRVAALLAKFNGEDTPTAETSEEAAQFIRDIKVLTEEG